MQFPDLIDKQHAPMRFGYRAGLGLRNACNAHSACPLVDGVMDRADERICDSALVEASRRGINLRKLGFR